MHVNLKPNVSQWWKSSGIGRLVASASSQIIFMKNDCTKGFFGVRYCEPFILNVSQM